MRPYLRTRIIAFASLLALPVAAQAQGLSPTPVPEVERRVEELLGRLTLEQKIDLVGGQDNWGIRGYPDLGWPRQNLRDGPMGVNDGKNATAFPAGIGLAATWDQALARRIGESIGRECRAHGIHYLLGPGVNLYRAPLNGRNFEYFGEDPWLAGRTAVGYIRGVQSQGVVATVKHFMGNNSEFDRNKLSSQIDERTEREIYLPAFEAAVKEGRVGSVMTAYNRVGGVQMSQHSRLINQVLKQDWGFRGVVMSDWGSTYDGVAVANAGMDLEMGVGYVMNRKTLLPAIAAGKVSVATIDDKVRRIIRTAVEFGFLGREQLDVAQPRYSTAGRATALAGAEQSIVLLKNEAGLLPLDPAAIKRVAILGPNAHPAQPVGGGSAHVRPYGSVSFLEGLSRRLGPGVQVLHDAGIVTEDEIVNRTAFALDAKGERTGLRAEYFSSGDFSGEPRIQTVNRLDFRGRNELPGGNASPARSMRWTGFYRPQKTETHYLLVKSSRRSTVKVVVDGRSILSPALPEWRPTRWVAVPMEANRAYPLAIECTVEEGANLSQLAIGISGAAAMITPEARRFASLADVAVVCVGFNSGNESESFDRAFELPGGQDPLIQEVHAANPKTIVVLTAGGSVDATAWVDRIPAFLHTWFPGQEGGEALARIVCGDVNPSGHLPITFERSWADNPVKESYFPNAPDNSVEYREGVFVGYRGYERNGTKPLFPFGFGLSYTQFAFRSLTIEPAKPKVGQPVTVSFDVANVGSRAGAAVGQLYVGNPTARVPRPAKELKGFERVMLQPGESRRVTLVLEPRAMSFWDVTTHAWVQEPGTYTVHIGQSSAEIDLEAALSVAR